MSPLHRRTLRSVKAVKPTARVSHARERARAWEGLLVAFTAFTATLHNVGSFQALDGH